MRRLTITDSAAAPVAPGTTFTLIHYTGTETGMFSINGAPVPEGGLVSLGGENFVLNYAVGDPSVVLTAVATPEPSAVLMALVAGAVFVVLLRRARV